jgi:hypothetical protein
MAPAVYIFGALISLACGILLIKGYLRVKRNLLFWSGLCFMGLAVSNLLIFVDLVVFPNVDLYFWRLITAAVAMLLLLYGLIWEGE